MNKLGNGGRFTRHDLKSSSLSSRTIQTAGNIYAAKKVEAGEQVKVDNVKLDNTFTQAQADVLSNMPFALSDNDVSLSDSMSFTLKNSGAVAKLTAHTDGKLHVNGEAVGGVTGITSAVDLVFDKDSTFHGDLLIGNLDVKYTLEDHISKLSGFSVQGANLYLAQPLVLHSALDLNVNNQTVELGPYLHSHATDIADHKHKLTKITYDFPNSSNVIIDAPLKLNSTIHFPINGVSTNINDELIKLIGIQNGGGQTIINRQLRVATPYPLIIGVEYTTGTWTDTNVATELKKLVGLTAISYDGDTSNTISGEVETIIGSYVRMHGNVAVNVNNEWRLVNHEIYKLTDTAYDNSAKTRITDLTVINDLKLKLSGTDHILSVNGSDELTLNGNAVGGGVAGIASNSTLEMSKDVVIGINTNNKNLTVHGNLTTKNLELTPYNTPYTLSVDGSGQLTLNGTIVGGSGGGGTVDGIASNTNLVMSKDVVIGTESETKNLTVHGKLTLPQVEFDTVTVTGTNTTSSYSYEGPPYELTSGGWHSTTPNAGTGVIKYNNIIYMGDDANTSQTESQIGLNVVIVKNSGIVLSSYNTHSNGVATSTAFANDINAVLPGELVLLVVKNSGSYQLQQVALDALTNLGAIEHTDYLAVQQSDPPWEKMNWSYTLAIVKGSPETRNEKGGDRNTVTTMTHDVGPINKSNSYTVETILPIDPSQAIIIGTGDLDNVKITSAIVGNPNTNNYSNSHNYLGDAYTNTNGEANYIYKWQHPSEDANERYFHFVWRTTGHADRLGMAARLKIYKDGNDIKALAIDEVAVLKTEAWYQSQGMTKPFDNTLPGEHWYDADWGTDINYHIGFELPNGNKGYGFFPASTANGDPENTQPRYAYATSGMVDSRQNSGWGIDKVTFQMTGSNEATGYTPPSSSTSNISKLTINGTDWRGNVFCQLKNDYFLNAAFGDGVPADGLVAANNEDWGTLACWHDQGVVNPFTDFFALITPLTPSTAPSVGHKSAGLTIKIPGYYKVTCHLNVYNLNPNATQHVGICFQFALNNVREGPVGIIRILESTAGSAGSTTLSHIIQTTNATDNITVQSTTFRHAVTTPYDNITLWPGYSQLRIERL